MSIQSIKLSDPMIWHITEDAKIKILSYLSPQDLAKCSMVSTAWRNLASTDFLWKGLFPDLTIPQGMGAKKYIDTLNPVFSHDQILQRIEKLYNNVQLEQRIAFTCSFPLIPTCSIKILFEYCDPAFLEAEPNVRDVCTFVGKLCENGTYITHSGLRDHLMSQHLGPLAFFGSMVQLKMPDTQVNQNFLAQIQSLENHHKQRLIYGEHEV